MSDFLSNLVGRVTGQAQRLQPVIPPLFATERMPRGGSEELEQLDRPDASSRQVRPRFGEPEGGTRPLVADALSGASPGKAPPVVPASDDASPPAAPADEHPVIQARSDTAPESGRSSSRTRQGDVARRTVDAESSDAGPPDRADQRDAEEEQRPREEKRQRRRLRSVAMGREQGHEVSEVAPLIQTEMPGPKPETGLASPMASAPAPTLPRRRFAAQALLARSSDEIASERLLMDGPDGRADTARSAHHVDGVAGPRLPLASPALVPTPKAAPKADLMAVPPVIEVTIGRVEVRAVQAPARRAPAPKPSNPAKLSLEDYLRGSRGR